jgi:hypothetical protein
MEIANVNTKYGHRHPRYSTNLGILDEPRCFEGRLTPGDFNVRSTESKAQTTCGRIEQLVKRLLCYKQIVPEQ